MKKWERVKDSVRRIEKGQRGEFTLSRCADYVAWVAKFKKVPESEWVPVCETIAELFENGYNIY